MARKRKEREEETDFHNHFQGHTSKIERLPTRPHLLKIFITS
jgi:hypothetical protein